jgi:hypothetical protein
MSPTKAHSAHLFGVRAGLWSSVLGLEQELECDSNPTARKAPENEEKAAVR